MGSIGRGAALSACLAMPGAMKMAARRAVAARTPEREGVRRGLIMEISSPIAQVDGENDQIFR
jgi:hypothetical protein